MKRHFKTRKQILARIAAAEVLYTQKIAEVDRQIKNLDEALLEESDEYENEELERLHDENSILLQQCAVYIGALKWVLGNGNH